MGAWFEMAGASLAERREADQHGNAQHADVESRCYWMT
jgi:hypothetical protein